MQTRASGEYRFSGGELQHSKKLPALRGLNVNHNHDLKNLFKSAATHASTSTEPLGDFYRSLLAKGMKPTMARLTLARKMAAIVLTIWKKGGTDLFCSGADGKMMAAEVKRGAQFAAGVPKPLFQTRLAGIGYDVAKDGRFLIPTAVEQSGTVPITVVVNWTAGLRK